MMSTTSVKGRVPERKPDGRSGPPKGYPKNPELYADPYNWKYPVHTPWHARAARRYFDEMTNRRKYTEEERQYIDWKIDEALTKFSSPRPEPTPKPPSTPQDIDSSSLQDVLEILAGRPRMQRAAEIARSKVALEEVGLKRLKARVKDYTVQIELRKRRIMHDCQDWEKRREEKFLCKHVAAVFLKLDEEKSLSIVRSIMRDRSKWSFETP
jgi:hypothetical protein